MKDHLAPFLQIDWESQSPGLRSKKCIYGNYQVRLVEFSDGFVESNWCEKEHTALIIEGSCSVVFPDHTENFKNGDIIVLPNGEDHKHKVVIGKEEKVLLLLFESAIINGATSTSAPS